MNIDSSIYQILSKNQGGVRLICLVKDLSGLRPHRLNQFDTTYLPPASPWPRQALEEFRQAIQKQRLSFNLDVQRYGIY